MNGNEVYSKVKSCLDIARIVSRMVLLISITLFRIKYAI